MRVEEARPAVHTNQCTIRRNANSFCVAATVLHRGYEQASALCYSTDKHAGRSPATHERVGTCHAVTKFGDGQRQQQGTPYNSTAPKSLCVSTYSVASKAATIHSQVGKHIELVGSPSAFEHRFIPQHCTATATASVRHAGSHTSSDLVIACVQLVCLSPECCRMISHAYCCPASL